MHSIAIIEDEVILRDALHAAFEREGFTVFDAEDGETGLKLIREQQPDMVLLDLFLPVMSGMEILEELAEDASFDDEKTKILVLTNYAEKQHEPIIEDMTIGYLLKSKYPLQEIVAKVKEALE